MNDPGLDEPINDGAQRVDGNQDREDASIQEEQEEESAFLDPTCKELSNSSHDHKLIAVSFLVTITSIPPYFLLWLVPLVLWRQPSTCVL